MRWLRLLRLLHQLRWLRLLRHLRSIYCSFGFWGPILPIVLRIGALAALAALAARSCTSCAGCAGCACCVTCVQYIVHWAFILPIVLRIGALDALAALAARSCTSCAQLRFRQRSCVSANAAKQTVTPPGVRRIDSVWHCFMWSCATCCSEPRTTSLKQSEKHQYSMIMRTLNTLRPRQYGRHFADDIFKGIFITENCAELLLARWAPHFDYNSPAGNLGAVAGTNDPWRCGLASPSMGSWINSAGVLPHFAEHDPSAEALEGDRPVRQWIT